MEFYGHWQNLNRDTKNRVIGSGLWRGRAWLTIGRLCLQAHWSFGKFARLCSVSLCSGGLEGHKVSLCLALPHLFYLALGVDYGGRDTPERDLSLRIFDNKIWLRFFGDPDGWGWKAGRMIVLCPVDWLLGRQKFSRVDKEAVQVQVALPEGLYPATITLYEAQWKRPRWPRTTRASRAEVEMQRPIPVPGKGENVWDVDEDAIYGLTCNALSAAEAVRTVVESAERDRQKYGGANWKPSKN